MTQNGFVGFKFKQKGIHRKGQVLKPMEESSNQMDTIK